MKSGNINLIGGEPLSENMRPFLIDKYDYGLGEHTFNNYSMAYVNLFPNKDNFLIPCFDNHKSIKPKLPGKEELWSEARKQLKKEEGQFLYVNYHYPLDVNKVEEKVIDLFLNKLKKIVIQYGVPASKVDKILSKLISKFEYHILDYLGIAYQRHYLYQKLNPNLTASVYCGSFSLIDVSSTYYNIPLFSEENKTEEILSQLFSAVTVCVVEWAPGIDESPNQVGLVDTFINMFRKDLGIQIFRNSSRRKKKEYCVLSHFNINLADAVISFMYYKASLRVCA